jgi:hypothetical protein
MTSLVIDAGDIVERSPHELRHVGVRVCVGMQWDVDIETGFRGFDV